MHSEVLLAASGNRLPRIQCRGGIQARCTLPDTVHLVSAAATPLGGDTIDIRVIVEQGARLKLRSAAAAVALPGASSLTSHARWEIEVTGSLDVDLEPTVVAAAARPVSRGALFLHDDGRVRRLRHSHPVRRSSGVGWLGLTFVLRISPRSTQRSPVRSRTSLDASSMKSS